MAGSEGIGFDFLGLTRTYLYWVYDWTSLSLPSLHIVYCSSLPNPCRLRLETDLFYSCGVA
jgi:hypothetical protein